MNIDETEFEKQLAKAVINNRRQELLGMFAQFEAERQDSSMSTSPVETSANDAGSSTSEEKASTGEL